jgi:hypothetical protein
MGADALKALAAAGKAKPVKAAWRAPRFEDFQAGGYYGRTVLCADPSLRKCAAVLLSICGSRFEPARLNFFVHAVKTFATDSHEAGGYEESLRKALDLSTQLKEWIPEAARGHVLKDIEVVHEGPPIGMGKAMIRPESSLLGGMALRVAARDLGLAVHKMVMPLSHKGFIVEIPRGTRVTKAQHHAALKVVTADLNIQGMDLITNEDLRDAISVGLFHLTRPPKEGS